MLENLESYQYNILKENAQDQLVILPRRRGKTHIILEKINYREDYRQVGVILPNNSLIKSFLADAEKYFKVQFLMYYKQSNIYEFENVKGDTIIVCLFNGSTPIYKLKGLKFDLFLDCLFIDEGDYVDFYMLYTIFSVYKDLYVTGTLKYSSPQLNSCMGHLCYNHLEDFKLVNGLM